MGVYALFSIFNKKYGGYINSLKLSKFWSKLSNDEQQIAKDAFAKTFYPEAFNTDSIDGKSHKINTALSSSDFLYKTSLKIILHKNYALAEKFLVEAASKEKSAAKKHLILTDLIEVYYKQRSEKEDALDKCVFYCQKDISLTPNIIKEFNEIPSFKRLAIILESKEQFNEAISISEQALKYGLSDGTKGGFEGRIAKLKTKIS